MAVSSVPRLVLGIVKMNDHIPWGRIFMSIPTKLYSLFSLFGKILLQIFKFFCDEMIITQRCKYHWQ